jgi:hypothetical protein
MEYVVIRHITRDLPLGSIKIMQTSLTAKNAREAAAKLYQHCLDLAAVTRVDSTVQLQSKKTCRVLAEFKVLPYYVAKVGEA